jgi:hypothetical protein
MAPFQVLPREIHELIVTFLDPIGLISLSQACQYFRMLIKPDQHHFMQRLLALELVPEYGGPIPTIVHSPINHTIDPPLSERQAWKFMRYACVRCLKLLPPTRFANQCLLRMGTCKPARDSEPARQLADWTPGDSRGSKAWWIKRQKQIALWKEDERALRDEFQEAQWAHDSAEAERVGALISGLHRDKRTCNECRFQMGFYNRHCRSNVGNSLVPVVIGSPSILRNKFERYFPGLFAYVDLNTGEPLPELPSDDYGYGSAFSDIFYTLYSVRCAACGNWQELAAYRVGSDYSRVLPRTQGAGMQTKDSNADDSIHYVWCNHCIGKKYGEKKLEESLLVFWRLIVRSESTRFRSSFVNGWVTVQQLRTVNIKYTSDIDLILEHLPQKITASMRPTWELSLDDLKASRVAFSMWKKFFENEWDHTGLSHRPYERLCDWTKYYDFHEGFWLWATGINERVETDPSLLTKYVLNGNPYAM